MEPSLTATNTTQAPAFTQPDSPRGRLLVQAAHLFREKGYERTTVRDLAAAVGIQSGSIFHHFRSKEEILQAVMTEAILFNTQRIRQRLAAVGTVEEKLRALVACELKSVNGRTGEAMAVLVYEWRSLSAESQARILKLRDVYEGLWMEVLQQAADQGMISADPFVVRRFLTGALSWTTTWYRREGGMTLEDLADQAMAMLQLSSSPEDGQASGSPKH
ncbi:MAG: TetR/AcrR family transcriptional regulator [Halomonadaceae bacterium]|nr:MAG: TetR/AcrR family transcriptional regulator [Halomonadaceae bacterium]